MRCLRTAVFTAKVITLPAIAAEVPVHAALCRAPRRAWLRAWAWVCSATCNKCANLECRCQCLQMYLTLGLTIKKYVSLQERIPLRTMPLNRVQAERTHNVPATGSTCTPALSPAAAPSAPPAPAPPPSSGGYGGEGIGMGRKNGIMPPAPCCECWLK